MKFISAFSVFFAAVSAQRFEAYSEADYQGQTQVITQEGWFYLTPAANSYRFDSDGGKWAFKAPAGGTASCGGDEDVPSVASPLISVEIAPAADFC
ncbi:uncharacterized protein BDV17DRAFT_275517 [Aspergillus undulatus]|uniref:uncharacterized protein n=1 Tax=Aspergillus undulatus TaxID=1810928 RepID=UPI003CCDD0BE